MLAGTNPDGKVRAKNDLFRAVAGPKELDTAAGAGP